MYLNDKAIVGFARLHIILLQFSVEWMKSQVLFLVRVSLVAVVIKAGASFDCRVNLVAIHKERNPRTQSLLSRYRAREISYCLFYE